MDGAEELLRRRSVSERSTTECSEVLGTETQALKPAGHAEWVSRCLDQSLGFQFKSQELSSGAEKVTGGVNSRSQSVLSHQCEIKVIGSQFVSAFFHLHFHIDSSFLSPAGYSPMRLVLLLDDPFVESGHGVIISLKSPELRETPSSRLSQCNLTTKFYLSQ